MNETTVKEFIKLLEPYAKNDKAIITDQENQPFIHMSNKTNGDLIISTEKPIGYCNRSGGYVFPTSVEDYLGVVPELDENVDLGEITLPKLDEEENPTKFGPAIEHESKYKKAFYLLLSKVSDDLPQEIWDVLYTLDVDLDVDLDPIYERVGNEIRVIESGICIARSTMLASGLEIKIGMPNNTFDLIKRDCPDFFEIYKVDENKINGKFV